MGRRSRARAVLGVVVGAALACSGGPEPPSEPADAVSTAESTGETDAGPGSRAGPRSAAGPTEEWLGQRALAEVDSVFPHSEHRAVDCQRCHTRPASHVTHTGAACTTCHRRPAILASLPERSARECAQCHHVEHAERACTSCHGRDAVGPRPMLLAIEAAGATEPRVRSVTFAHALHSGRSCRECHTQPVMLRFGGDCTICHESHHRPEAECTTCHEAAGLDVHATTDVHEGCGGGGCHQDATVLRLRPTRNICLTCHTDMVDHMAGRECVTCHAMALDRLGGRAGGE